MLPWLVHVLIRCMFLKGDAPMRLYGLQRVPDRNAYGNSCQAPFRFLTFYTTCSRLYPFKAL